MLEEVLQNGKSAIRDFLSQVPDSTGQSMAASFGEYFGHIGSFAEMSENSVRRSKRICETSLSSLHDTDLSRLEFQEHNTKAFNELQGNKRQPADGRQRVEINAVNNQRSLHHEDRNSHQTEHSGMEEKGFNRKTLCRSLPAMNEAKLDETTRENVVRLKRANEAAGDLIKYINSIASLLCFSDQVCQVHSRVCSSVHRLEQTVGAVCATMDIEISSPEKLARAALEFSSHVSDVSMVIENFEKILEKTQELQSLTSSEITGINDFYSQDGNSQNRRLVAKSAFAKGCKKHNEAIVAKIHDYIRKTKGRLESISKAYNTWKCVQEAMRERDRAIKAAVSVLQTAPCKMPGIVYEVIPDNEYSLKPREIGELQKVIDDSVRTILGGLTQRIQLMQDVQPKLEFFEERHINKTSTFPSFILLNETRYASRNSSWIKVDTAVPHIHLFPFAHPMSIPDKGIAQILLLRLATALPLGCCDFTILDHESQGDSVLGLAPMKSVPDLVNLVVRRDQIANALMGLYEYSGKLVEDGYFTTDAPDWKSYNAKHPDSPLPYKVLVVFSLTGIERVTDGMSMLQSLMKNGYKRGVHVIFSGDAHNQVCGNDPKFASDRKNRFSEVAIDVIQS